VALRTAYVNPANGADGGYARLAGAAEWQRPLGRPTLVLGTALGAVAGGVVPTQDLVRFGGITTGPGYSFHSFAGEYAWSQRGELRVPVPFPSITLFRFGRTPPHMTLAPYGHVVCVAERSGGEDGCYPSLGVGAAFLFDLLRFDLAYGLREEGGWRFGVDVGRVFWEIL
jgi:hemolysin activation/secretion protein